MKLYYNNYVKEAELTAIDIAPYSDIENINSDFLDLPVEFLRKDNVILSGTWTEIKAIDSLIISYTNVRRFRIQLRWSNILMFDTGEVNYDEYHKIVNIEETRANSFILTLIDAPDLIYLGNIYIGTVFNFSRFAVEPKLGEKLLSKGNRSFGGYAYGLEQPTLKTISISFKRIEGMEANRWADYIKNVTNVKPHFIDIYSEAHEYYPPVYGTYEGDLKLNKRNESYFFYDYDAEWLEAK